MPIVVESESFEKQTQTGILSDPTRQVLHQLYPDGFEGAQHSTQFIVAATNARVDFWNAAVQQLNTNRLYEFKSSNRISEVDDPYGYLKDMLRNDTLLSELNAYDVPPHNLRLKKGDVCLLYCNYSKTEGLTKNTRVKVVEIRDNFIGVQKLDDGSEGPVTYLPRCPFEFQSNYGHAYKFIRIQFPLRLAYCLSYNRSQGQSAKRIVVDIVVPPFCHGHMYVAFSTARRYDGCIVYCSKEQAVTDDDGTAVAVVVPSITHKEVIDRCYNKIPFRNQ